MSLSVREIQIRVAGYAVDKPKQEFLKIDGKMGPKTKAAIERFESAYGLHVDGIVGPQTLAALRALEGPDGPDGRTKHFKWSEFESKDGKIFSDGNVSPKKVRENVRRLMWKLEALRRKAGDKPIKITSGFRSKSHNRSIRPPGARTSQHVYGTAADIKIKGKTLPAVQKLAKTCGLSCIMRYTTHIHVDSRKENPDNRRNFYWPEKVF